MAPPALLSLLGDASSAADSLNSLYTALGSVAVALIGGTFALLTARGRNADPPSVRYVDPPTSNSLPQALSELYEDAVQEAAALRFELEQQRTRADLWEARALHAGWTGAP